MVILQATPREVRKPTILNSYHNAGSYMQIFSSWQSKIVLHNSSNSSKLCYCSVHTSGRSIPAAVSTLLVVGAASFLERNARQISIGLWYTRHIVQADNMAWLLQPQGYCKEHTTAGVKVSASLISPQYFSSLTTGWTVGGRLPSWNTASRGMLKVQKYR